MKKWKLFINVLFTGLLFFSCASAPLDKDKKIDTVSEEELIVEEVVVEKTAEELFLEGLSGIKLEFTKKAAKTKKNKDFSSAYEILVKDSASMPVSNFELTLNLPEKKEGTELFYKNVNLKTDENGIVSFLPDTPDFAAKALITARPAIPQGLNITDEELSAYTVTADYLSESDITAKGAIMFVFEYNENNRAPKNSYDILSGLRNKGVYQIGNAPISDSEYINVSKERIYKENFEYVGTDFGYLIGGTVKFVTPVEKTEDGNYSAHLIAYIYGIEMKTGNVIYEETTEYTSSGTNWNKAVESCKTELTSMIVDSIMFGL